MRSASALNAAATAALSAFGLPPPNNALFCCGVNGDSPQERPGMPTMELNPAPVPPALVPADSNGEPKSETILSAAPAARARAVTSSSAEPRRSTFAVMPGMLSQPIYPPSDPGVAPTPASADGAALLDPPPPSAVQERSTRER